ncbi:DUF2651 family protein [Salisediminibacterium halotolerans]|uniref:Uncharacterized protein n=1 Tax=Salisediminibacterium halotolerans TaxID=517425 RepID=A0A1H9TA16_9BACI|nr:DUF2651 family protein [Salisediminibacterium haloalkalitolerans]SER93473.1 Protein of unknown function [Salisediminibacterium haloalkalitolerans]
MTFYHYALFIFPAAAAVLGALGYVVFRNLYLMPLLVLLISAAGAFTLFNPGFLIAAPIYMVIAWFGGSAVILIKRGRGELW